MKHPFYYLILVLIMVLIPKSTMAYDFKEGGLCYNFNEDGKSVTMTYEHLILFAYDAPAPKEKGYIGNVSIPETVKHNGKTYKVTAIDRGTFMGNSELKKVVIPKSVKTIGKEAFMNCYSLKEVILPPDLTEMSDYMFTDCGFETIVIPAKVKSIGESVFGNSSLKSIVIPNSVKKIGKSAFSGCRWMKTVTMGNSVESIGEAAFSICSDLKNIKLPASLKEIGPKAFYECGSIEDVVIPASVNTIGAGAFNNCHKLKSLKVEKGNKKYDSRDNCNAIIETATGTLLAGCDGSAIPSSVTAIGTEAFAGCYGLKDVNIPSSVTQIGNLAFFYCKNLKELKIPNSVERIGERAFCGCDSLEYVEICDSVKYIGYGAFLHDDHIKIVLLGSGVKAIDSWAFKGLDALEALVSRIKDVSKVKMGKEVFDEIDKSKCGLTIPNRTSDIYRSTPQWNEFKRIIMQKDMINNPPSGCIKKR